MLHFLPDSSATEMPAPYAEAVARLASIRQALNCVEQLAGDTPSPSSSEARLAIGWPQTDATAKRCFEARSASSASGAAAGLEAIAALHAQGLYPNPAAVAKLAEALRADLGDIDLLFSL